MSASLVVFIVPYRLQWLKIIHRHCRDAEAFFYQPMDHVRLVWREQMAAAAVDLGKQGGIIQGRDIFQCDEFHGLTILGVSCLLSDQYADHCDALTDETMHLRGWHRSQVLKLFTIESQRMAASEKAERFDFMDALLSGRIVVRYR